VLQACGAPVRLHCVCSRCSQSPAKTKVPPYQLPQAILRVRQLHSKPSYAPHAAGNTSASLHYHCLWCCIAVSCVLLTSKISVEQSANFATLQHWTFPHSARKLPGCTSMMHISLN
jgi:hypothetical protein